ncbi:hypothetical protein K3495_g11571 [Podosphaera aphanis]|nr:hypothetical protein K3495_g11571 [Podosphaera aphanis]
MSPRSLLQIADEQCQDDYDLSSALIQTVANIDAARNMVETRSSKRKSMAPLPSETRPRSPRKRARHATARLSPVASTVDSTAEPYTLPDASPEDNTRIEDDHLEQKLSLIK